MDGNQQVLMHLQINTYMSFAKDVLPRIRSLGYNALQIMAVQEHAYYGSFGYHVTNFFAVGALFSSCNLLGRLRDSHMIGQLRLKLTIWQSTCPWLLQAGLFETAVLSSNMWISLRAMACMAQALIHLCVPDAGTVSQASSRFGTPDELKYLIDEAHRLGLFVLMDIVHSHASKNTNDGINMFDGTDAMYFHGGGRGYHWMWDSRCFNYGQLSLYQFPS